MVKLEEAFRDGPMVCLVLQLLPGGDLSGHIKERGRLNIEQSRFFGAQIVLALEHLHANSVLYRDLKPANVVLDADGNAVLTDMGIAQRGLISGEFCGTPYYLAPEVIQHRTYNEKVDWWAYGVVLYELLTGSTPFIGSTPQVTFQLIQVKAPSFPQYVPSTARELILKLLKKKPKDRLAKPKKIKVQTWFKQASGIESLDPLDWNALEDMQLQPPPINPDAPKDGDKSCSRMRQETKASSSSVPDTSGWSPSSGFPRGGGSPGQLSVSFARVTTNEPPQHSLRGSGGAHDPRMSISTHGGDINPGGQPRRTMLSFTQSNSKVLPAGVNPLMLRAENSRDLRLELTSPPHGTPMHTPYQQGAMDSLGNSQLSAMDGQDPGQTSMSDPLYERPPMMEHTAASGGVGPRSGTCGLDKLQQYCNNNKSLPNPRAARNSGGRGSPHPTPRHSGSPRGGPHQHGGGPHQHGGGPHGELPGAGAARRGLPAAGACPASPPVRHRNRHPPGLKALGGFAGRGADVVGSREQRYSAPVPAHVFPGQQPPSGLGDRATTVSAMSPDPVPPVAMFPRGISAGSAELTSALCDISAPAVSVSGPPGSSKPDRSQITKSPIGDRTLPKGAHPSESRPGAHSPSVARKSSLLCVATSGRHGGGGGRAGQPPRSPSAESPSRIQTQAVDKAHAGHGAHLSGAQQSTFQFGAFAQQQKQPVEKPRFHKSDSFQRSPVGARQTSSQTAGANERTEKQSPFGSRHPSDEHRVCNMDQKRRSLTVAPSAPSSSQGRSSGGSPEKVVPGVSSPNALVPPRRVRSFRAGQNTQDGPRRVSGPDDSKKGNRTMAEMAASARVDGAVPVVRPMPSPSGEKQQSFARSSDGPAGRSSLQTHHTYDSHSRQQPSGATQTVPVRRAGRQNPQPRHRKVSMDSSPQTSPRVQARRGSDPAAASNPRMSIDMRMAQSARHPSNPVRIDTGQRNDTSPVAAEARRQSVHATLGGV